MLNAKDDWRKLKEKYGIPDGISSFGMGDRVDKWKKQDTAAGSKNFQQRMTVADAMLKDMKTYEEALKKAKPAKFKGKNPGEQTKNWQDAKTAFHAEIVWFESHKSNMERMANPIKEVRTQLKAARAKLAGIAKDDLTALQHFYGQEIRNNVGLPLIQLGKVNTDPKIKIAIDAWGKQGDAINDMCNSDTHKDTAQIWSACQLALAGLAFAIGAE